LAQRPGVIINGARNLTARCGARLNPMDFLQDDALSIAHTPSGDKQKSIELQALTIMPSMDTTRLLNSKKDGLESRSPYYPNAGCGYGNFNVHLPRVSNGSVDEGQTSSVSSMSSATGQSTQSRSSSGGLFLHDMNSGLEFPTDSILEKYTQAVEELEQAEHESSSLSLPMEAIAADANTNTNTNTNAPDISTPRSTTTAGTSESAQAASRSSSSASSKPATTI
jgi:hypothetical protein